MSKWDRYPREDESRLAGKYFCSRRQDDNYIADRNEALPERIRIDSITDHRDRYRVAPSKWIIEQDYLDKARR